MTLRTRILVASALVAGFATPASAMTNIVLNGGFETGSFASWTGTSNAFNGFAATLITSTPANVHTGVYAAQLRTIGANTINTLSQNVATTIARPYLMTYWARNRDNNGSVIDSLAVTSGSTVTNFADRPSFPYTQFSQYFVANSASSVISFSYKHFSPGFFIDDVVVTMVPEPETWGLMIAGFGMVGFAMRRQVRSVAV